MFPLYLIFEDKRVSSLQAGEAEVWKSHAQAHLRRDRFVYEKVE